MKFWEILKIAEEKGEGFHATCDICRIFTGKTGMVHIITFRIDETITRIINSENWRII